MISSCFLVKVHNSQLYVNILSMWLLNILSLVCFEVFLLSKMYFNWLYVFVASIFLLFMSLSVSRKLPKYLRFFQVSSPPLLMTYSSDFVSFICRFFSFNVDGTAFFKSSFNTSTFVIQPIGSLGGLKNTSFRACMRSFCSVALHEKLQRIDYLVNLSANIMTQNTPSLAQVWII